MKKLVLVVVMIMVVSLFTGCGQTKRVSETKHSDGTITYTVDIIDSDGEVIEHSVYEKTE